MASTNNALNNTSLNRSGVTGNNQTFTVSNPDDSGASSAAFQIQIGGSTTTGDAGIRHTVLAAGIWSTGIDNSANDSFVTCASNTLGTNNRHTISTSGINNWVSQSASTEVAASNSNDRTGAGTVWLAPQPGGGTYTGFGEKGLSFTNSGFVMPATFTSGCVLFTACVTLTDCTINTGIEIRIVTSNRTYSKIINRPADSTDIVASINAICDMDASDTARTAVIGIGEAGNTNDLVGGTAIVKTFYSLYTMG